MSNEQQAKKWSPRFLLDFIKSALRVEMIIRKTAWHEMTPREREVLATYQAELRDAYRHISAEMAEAPYGAHGAVFIDRTEDGKMTTVTANRRVLAVRHPSGFVGLYTRPVSEEKLTIQRNTNRRHECLYKAHLEVLGRLLWKSGIFEINFDENPGFEINHWFHIWGQKGGKFRNTLESQVSISANGALRRARQIRDREGEYRASA